LQSIHYIFVRKLALTQLFGFGNLEPPTLIQSR